MLSSRPTDSLRQEVEKIVSPFSVEIIEVSQQKKDGTIRVYLILYSAEGLDLALCSKIHKLLIPRLEIFLGSQDVALEVSSPGLERVFKYQEELQIFLQKKIKVWSTDFHDWVSGLNQGVEGVHLSLKIGEEITRIPLNTIQKAKLNELEI